LNIHNHFFLSIFRTFITFSGKNFWFSFDFFSWNCVLVNFLSNVFLIDNGFIFFNIKFIFLNYSIRIFSNDLTLGTCNYFFWQIFWFSFSLLSNEFIFSNIWFIFLNFLKRNNTSGLTSHIFSNFFRQNHWFLFHFLM
jgi:hypothetical protein